MQGVGIAGIVHAVGAQPDLGHQGRHLVQGPQVQRRPDELSANLDCGGHPVVQAGERVNHGDPLASNILISPAGTPVLLDWEFGGLFLPGFDLAMLHTQLGAGTPAIRERIDAIITEAGAQAAFAVNLAIVLTRELRIYRELPDGAARDACLPLIASAWEAARERIRRLATGKTP